VPDDAMELISSANGLATEATGSTNAYQRKTVCHRIAKAYLEGRNRSSSHESIS
jgi:hypothetical protein